MSDNVKINTPNGDNNRYTSNLDTGNLEIKFVALVEKDPEREANVGGNAGSNTEIKPVEIGVIVNDEIQKVGYVGIPVGTLTPELRKAIEARAEKSQRNNELNAEKNAALQERE